MTGRHIRRGRLRAARPGPDLTLAGVVVAAALAGALVSADRSGPRPAVEAQTLPPSSVLAPGRRVGAVGKPPEQTAPASTLRPVPPGPTVLAAAQAPPPPAATAPASTVPPPTTTAPPAPTVPAASSSTAPPPTGRGTDEAGPAPATSTPTTATTAPPADTAPPDSGAAPTTLEAQP